MSKQKTIFSLEMLAIISLICVSCSPQEAAVNLPATSVPPTVAATPQGQYQLPASQPQNPTTPQPINPTDLQKIMQEAKANLLQLSADEALKFPLGVNNPLKRDNASAGNSKSSKLEAIGFVDAVRSPKPLKRDDLMQLLMVNINYRTSLIINNSLILVTNRSADLAQNGGEVPVIDLIVKNTEDGKFYLIPRVTVNHLVIDAVNAAFNKTISANDLDVSTLDSSRLIEGNQIRI